MEPSPAQLATMQSPCNKICTIDAESRLCIGCFRTLDEIGDWYRLSPEERNTIMQTLPARENLIAPDKRFKS